MFKWSDGRILLIFGISSAARHTVRRNTCFVYGIQAIQNGATIPYYKTLITSPNSEIYSWCVCRVSVEGQNGSWVGGTPLQPSPIAPWQCQAELPCAKQSSGCTDDQFLASVRCVGRDCGARLASFGGYDPSSFPARKLLLKLDVNSESPGPPAVSSAAACCQVQWV